MSGNAHGILASDSKLVTGKLYLFGKKMNKKQIMGNELIYNIRTKEDAIFTLETLTGISWYEWAKNSNRINDYQYADYFIEAMLDDNNMEIPIFDELKFVFSHITTSGNVCRSIAKHGLLDLINSYECMDSEIRIFLDKHGIYINVDKKTLEYQGCIYDIHFDRYDPAPYSDTVDYYAWSVGRKFYFDYTVCGFLSINPSSPYGGYVHMVPEIISDIDRLLGTNYQNEWVQNTRAYEIVAQVNGSDIVIDPEVPEREQMISYILMAYNEAWDYKFENILLMKNGIQIMSEDILDIIEFNEWYGK